MLNSGADELNVQYRPGKQERSKDCRRYVCGGLGTQHLSGVVRNFLHQVAHSSQTSAGAWSDLDFVNCFPTILWSLLQALGIPCPALKAYIERRDYYLERVDRYCTTKYGVQWSVSPKLAKTAFISIIHQCGNYKSVDGIHPGGVPLLDVFAADVRLACAALSQHVQLKEVARLVRLANNPVGSLVAIVCQRVEHAALALVFAECEKAGVVPRVNMFDGVLVTGFAGLTTGEQDTLLRSCEAAIAAELGIPLKLKEKSIPEVTLQQLHDASRKLVTNDAFDVFTETFSSTVHHISRRYVGWSLVCGEQVCLDLVCSPRDFFVAAPLMWRDLDPLVACVRMLKRTRLPLSRSGQTRSCEKQRRLTSGTQCSSPRMSSSKRPGALVCPHSVAS